MEIVFRSLNPDEDKLVDYLKQLQFWTGEIAAIVESRNNVLPECLVDLFRFSKYLPINGDVESLFMFLLKDMNGYPLSQKEIKNINDPRTSCGKLNSLFLVKVQDRSMLLKPQKIAFDARVQYLVSKKVIYSPR